MSQHPSFGHRPGFGSAHRSVLKRYERVKVLLEKKRWKDGDPVFSLPKVKTVRIKVRKEKAVAEEKAAATGAPAGGAATVAPAAGGKPATSSKEAPKGK